MQATICGFYWTSQWFSAHEIYFELQAHAYLAKLPEQLDEGALTKRVGEAGVEGQSGVLLGQNGHPPFLGGDKETDTV